MEMLSFPLLCKEGLGEVEELSWHTGLPLLKQPINSSMSGFYPTLILPLQRGGKWDLQSFKNCQRLSLVQRFKAFGETVGM